MRRSAKAATPLGRAPFDYRDAAMLDADAADIRDSACQLADIVLDRRAALDRAGKRHVPLFVLAGEVHSCPAHQLHNLVLTDLLSRREDIVTGVEYRHDLLAAAFRRAADREPSAAERAAMDAGDRDGRLTLQTFNTRDDNSAGHSRFTLISFLLRHALPGFLIDAVRTAGMPDTSDPSTARSILACGGLPATDDYPTESRFRMHVRNHHMAGMMARLASERPARIGLIFCGNAHVLGDRQYPAEESLAAHFQRLGLPFVAAPVMTTEFTEASLPELPYLNDNTISLAASLPKTVAIYDFKTGQTLDHNPTHLRNQDEEAAYCNAVLGRLGLAAEMLSVEAYRADRERFRLPGALGRPA